MSIVAEYTNATKPHDIATRQFHRIESPHYDLAVDPSDEVTPPEQLGRPDGVARRSGARGPQDFVGTGLSEKIAAAILDGLDTLLLIIPGVNIIFGALKTVNEAIKKFTDTDLIEEAKKELAKAIAQAFESALFDRFMRVIPAWVPVGREKYDPAKFHYPDPGGATRDATKEEEREVEGVLTASYQACNDVPETQWTHYARWHFHVRPLPGYRRVIGQGNIPILQEHDFIFRPDDALGTPRFKPVLDIYGQHTPEADPHDRSGQPRFDPNDLGAIECLFDVGAISRPPADGGSHGVMFDRRWPYWPMTGDHFWAAGRWVYDCARAGKPRGREDQQDELHPTQINPCKAIAFSRYEGFKFPENEGGVRAVRFFFLATTEGGYRNFRDEVDRDGKTHDPAIRLRDRDYTFIVDLPKLGRVRSPHPIGHTTRFMRNTLVIRPRLLMQIRFAPFVAGDRNTPAWASDLKFHDSVVPKVELIPPADPTERPSQAKITVPLTSLPAASGRRGEVYAFDLALGWHDPDGSEVEQLQQVDLAFGALAFDEDHGPVRIRTCINGRWRVKAIDQDVDEDDTVQLSHAEQFHLPKDARIAATIHGTARHGFGEFLEQTRLSDRRLRVGGIIDVKKDLEEKLAQATTVAQKVAIQANLDLVNALLDGMEDLIGQRYTPDWVSDIDAARESDEKKEQIRVSAIARELWVRPAPVINRHDEPIGWVDGVGDDLVPIGVRRSRGFVVPEWDRLSSPDRLVKFLQATREQRPPDQANRTVVRFEGSRLVMVGAANNLAEQINVVNGVFGDTKPHEYRALLEISVPQLP